MDATRQNSNADPYGFRRAFIQDQMRIATLVEEGEDPVDPTKRMELVSAVSAAADLAEEMGDAKSTESNLNWMIQLCQEELDRPIPRKQFLAPLATAHYNLGLVQWRLRRTDDALANFQVAASKLSLLEQFNPTIPEHGMLLLGSMINTAVIQIEQERYAEAERLIEKANETADRLVEQHPHSQECRTEHAKCRELRKQFQKRGLGSFPQDCTRELEKSSTGCGFWIILLLLGGLVRSMIRDAQRTAVPQRAVPHEAARAQELQI